MKKLSLQAEWKKYLSLRVEVAGLRARAAGLSARADGLWARAVLAIHGDITIEWKYRNGDFDCKLGNGELYKHPK
jgi:hypothetical protein